MYIFKGTCVDLEKLTLCPPGIRVYRQVSYSNFCQFSQKSFIRYPKDILFVYRVHVSPINDLVSQSTTRYTYLFILYRLKSTLERAWRVVKVIGTSCHIFYLYKKMLTCVLTSCQMVRSIEPNPNKKRYFRKTALAGQLSFIQYHELSSHVRFHDSRYL